MRNEIFKSIPGGLNLAVSPLFWNDNDDHTIAAVKECLQQVARAHGAEYNDEHLKKVRRLLTSGAMKGYVMRGLWGQAAHETCLPRTIAIALGSEAVILKKDGDRLLPYLADYRDDTAILRQSLSKLLRECPPGMHHPRGVHLSQYMEREIAGLLQGEQAVSQPIGTLAEVSHNNKLIMQVMEGVEAQIGPGAVYELGGPIPLDRWRVDVITELPTKNEASHIVLPPFFLTRWASNNAEIAAAFSLLPSSMSKSVPHVHVMSNGEIPDGKELEDILASLLTAGQEHINLRQAREQRREHFAHPSPIIDIHAGSRKALQSLVHLSSREIFRQLATQSPLFGEPLSEMRIYCFEEKLHRVIGAIDGMKVRQFGDHALYPVFLDNETVTKKPATRPLQRLGVVESQSFDIAA